MDGVSHLQHSILRPICENSAGTCRLKLVKTKKTSFLRGTIDPFYNESFSFKVPQEELENASLVFTGR